MQTDTNLNQVSAQERYGLPGEAHQQLTAMIGTWSVTMSIWVDGQEPAVTSSAITAHKGWINDGRHIREDLEGLFSGKAHRKLTILGYNNLRQRYELVTADNYDTVIMTYYSKVGKPESVIELVGELVMAGSGQQLVGSLVSLRSVFNIAHQDRHTLKIYYTEPGRSEYLFLEYVYTRLAGPQPQHQQPVENS